MPKEIKPLTKEFFQNALVSGCIVPPPRGGGRARPFHVWEVGLVAFFVIGAVAIYLLR